MAQCNVWSTFSQKNIDAYIATTTNFYYDAE